MDKTDQASFHYAVASQGQNIRCDTCPHQDLGKSQPTYGGDVSLIFCKLARGYVVPVFLCTGPNMSLSVSQVRGDMHGFDADAEEQRDHAGS